MSADARGSLVLDGLVKRYRDHTAVAGVSMDIAPGEFITLLGSSGSGKTTTLNIVAGFAKADEGSVRLDGVELSGKPPHKRGVGMVFQNYALFPHMTAAENIGFPLKMRRMSRSDRAERVKRALAMVRLEKFGDRYPAQLSGGQQQRIAVARAVVFQPHVLLMDEPLGALDKKLREALQLEIMRIHRELGVTVVYVTHDQEEALVMSDRIAVYSEGRIEQLGSAEELYERPATVFVADFMGESNIFRGRYRGNGASGFLHCGDTVIQAPTDAAIGDGTTAAIVVRPERTTVERHDGTSATEAGHNVLPGTLREVIYLGSVRKYLIELHDGTLTQARVSAGGEQALSIGEPVCLRWDADHSVLLPDVAGEPVAVASDASPEIEPAVAARAHS